MKHVIVICTSDEGEPLDEHIQTRLENAVENVLDAKRILGYTSCRFNVDSAVAAVREMYNAPE